ncbi:hypothetical protein C8R44DRAFT_17313 [Mycena epipterygia]|nr:hypothetical protein C8R44DRAFT_17313 [Mycena epipterygia]
MRRSAVCASWPVACARTVYSRASRKQATRRYVQITRRRDMYLCDKTRRCDFRAACNIQCVFGRRPRARIGSEQ